MPEFETPEPITATTDLAGGSLRVRAAGRTDTVVEVRPHNPDSGDDVQAAEQTRVEFTDGRLLVRTPRYRLRQYLSTGPRVDIVIDLPEGSELDATGWVEYTIEGRLGDVAINSALGEVRIERAGKLRAKTSMGDIVVGRVDGSADVHTSAGAIRIGEVDGTAVAKSSSGDVTVGEAGGSLRLNTAYGTIEVDRAATSVEATTSAGDIRIREVGGGTVVLRTSYGVMEIGVPADVAAWLDMTSKSGLVRSELDAADTPADTDRTVEIRARNQYGDIFVRRA